MIDLHSPRVRVLTFSLLIMLQALAPVESSAQSDTTEFRPSDANGARTQEFDERRDAQAQIQLVQWVQQNNPQLWQILEQWEQTTQGYKKLSGKHRRFVYDSVFQVEKRSDGIFYYEAPDKGRIDIEPVKIKPGEQSQKISPQGKPYALKSDIKEIWICDGKRIAQATNNNADKIYMIFPIPEMNQGVNIMDGPLPFLFGLPAKEAVTRYHITLLPNTDENFIWLKVLPQRVQDQQNWKEAQVILDRKTFLPRAVKLLDHAGTTETVYSFTDLKVNGNVILDLIFGRDPFNIEKVMKSKGYKLVKNNIVQGQRQRGSATPPGRAPLPQNNNRSPESAPPKVGSGNTPAQKAFMPNMLNADWKRVQKIFTDKGFDPEFRKAGPAPSQELVYKVAKQEPQQGTELTPGQKVIFYLYEEVKSAGQP